MNLLALCWIALHMVFNALVGANEPQSSSYECLGACSVPPPREHVMLQTRFKSQGKSVENRDQNDLNRWGALEIPWSKDCIIGAGFGSEAGCAYPSAVHDIPTCDDQQTTDAACLADELSDDVTSYTRDIRSTNDVSKLLEVAVKAEGSVKDIPAAVSVGVGVMLRSNLSSASVAFTVGAAGETESRSIQNPGKLRLTEAAFQLLRADPLGFLGRYSHYYVYKVVSGGSFMGALTLNTMTSSSSHALDFTLGVSLPFENFNGDVSVDFQDEVNKHQHELDIDLQVGWLGGSGIEFASLASIEALVAQYQQWQNSWRSDPHPLKIVLRRWIDVHEVQSIVNDLDRETRRVFTNHTIHPIIETELRKENEIMVELVSSLTRAMTWPELKLNRTAEFQLMMLQVRVMRHAAEVKNLDKIGVLRRQVEILNGDQSWFTGFALRREYEDVRHAIGRVCDDGSRSVDGICVQWAGTCNNGALRPRYERTADNQCGSCLPGFVFDASECRKFSLGDVHTSDQWDNAQHTSYLAQAEGRVCALQSVEVEDLTWSQWYPSAASCRVVREFGRWKMHTEATGSWADASCGGSCIATAYPVSDIYEISRNTERHQGSSGVSRRTMVSTGDSLCWLTTTSFWQASDANEWAECTVKPTGGVWEVQARVDAQRSRTGAECGAVCLHSLPSSSFSVAQEVVKTRASRGCAVTDLGDASGQHCFLSSVAVSHARDKYERPACHVETNGENRWVMRVCTGEGSYTQASCGVMCIAFVSNRP